MPNSWPVFGPNEPPNNASWSPESMKCGDQCQLVPEVGITLTANGTLTEVAKTQNFCLH